LFTSMQFILTTTGRPLQRGTSRKYRELGIPQADCST
jgi:hypothetical protein